MLQSLTIQNYALIDDLKIDFESGFSIITGETGAGKSILLGALSLLVGQRADASVLLNKTKKCIVEGVFGVREYNLQNFFKDNELDYNDQVIIRREIIDNSRSRAFVNDSPVNLNILKELGEKLVDIHSQHQNSYITDSQFQLKVIDILARNTKIINSYKNCFNTFSELKNQLADLRLKAEKEMAELEYFKFQFNELDKANLKLGEQSLLEEEFRILSNAEEIKSALVAVYSILYADQTGIVYRLKDAANLSGKIRQMFTKAASLQERLESAYLELKDLASESEKLSESIELIPSKLEEIKSRLDLLYTLCQKHRVSSADELLMIRDNFESRISEITNYDVQLNELARHLKEKESEMKSLAQKLSVSRKAEIPEFEEQVILLLRQLGMANANFSAKLEPVEEYLTSGCDKISFLFSANKQVEMQNIAKVASGGEMSRVMLAVKSVIASSLAMPAVIFDEIDAGVSGEVADKIGNIMKEMSSAMQVISITHLPQVACKGKNHYLVYKTEGDKATNTHMKLLIGEERVVEIAKMLSGEQISQAAISNARVLLKN
jgi:DNA repair protein RecN (Recombination protein N)